MNTIEIFGQPPAKVIYHSDDNRKIATKELADRNKCLELISFKCRAEADQDALRSVLPVRVEECWLPNPGYERDEESESEEWLRWWRKPEHHSPDERIPPAHFGEVPDGELYLPPEAKDLPLEPEEGSALLRERLRTATELDAGPTITTQLTALDMAFQEILEETLGPLQPADRAGICFSLRWASPGRLAVRAIFPDGTRLLLEKAGEVSLPDAAKAQRKMDGLADSVQQVICQAHQTATHLLDTRAQLRKAQEAAGMTLKEALKKWMRFNPPGMAADTKARIQRAVMTYLTDPDKHSLAKTAAEFPVSRKTVSNWLHRFEDETGFPVITHQRHESVKDHVESEQASKRTPPTAEDDFHQEME